MSRSGYTDELDPQALAMYRGQVASAIRGRRGQQLLRDMLAGLDALPNKRLVTGELQVGGEVCALGAAGRARGVDMDNLDPEDYERVARTFDVADQLAREVAYLNDEHWRPETPEQRWQRMRDWAASQLRQFEPEKTE